MVKRVPFLFVWRNALASEEGPGYALDRHVGMALALYFDPDGLSAWPSQDALALRTGISAKTVGCALKRLYDQGWLGRQPRKSPKGNPHKRYGYEYRARLPKRLADAYANGEAASLFNGKDPRKLSAGSNGEADDKTMAKPLRTNTSVEYITKGSAYRKEGITPATPAAREVQKRRAARDSFVADIVAAEAREKVAGEADRRAPASPASSARRGHGQQRADAEQPQPASSPDKQAATLEPQPRPQPAPAVVMSEGVIKMRLINRLTADGLLAVESTTPRVSSLVKVRGVGFAVNAEQELEQRGLVGYAASLFLDELMGLSRELAERRLDEHLALKMAKLHANGGRRESADAIKLRARSLARMREDDHLTWGEIWSIFVRLSEDEVIRGQLLIPGVLRHYWRKQLEAEQASVSTEAAP